MWELQRRLFISGGCNFEDRSVSKQLLEVNLSSKVVFKQKKLPVPKFAHGACFVCDKIVIASGISDMMLVMGLRMVPLGS